MKRKMEKNMKMQKKGEPNNIKGRSSWSMVGRQELLAILTYLFLTDTSDMSDSDDDDFVTDNDNSKQDDNLNESF